MDGRGRKLRERLARRTTSTAYIPEIDGLRFVAIGLVLLFHADLMMRLAAGDGRLTQPFGIVVLPTGAAASLFERVVLEGNVGVYLFFMISGYVLALPFLAARISGSSGPVRIGRYYARRVTRIEPPYVLCLLVLFALVWVADGRSLTGDLVAGLGYSHQAIFDSPQPLNGVMWSLEVEVQWYLVVPLLALLLTRGPVMRRRPMILMVAALAVLAQSLDPSGVIRGRIMLVDNLQYFLVGWFLADLAVSRRDRVADDRRWDAVAAVAWPALFVALLVGGSWWRVSIPVLGGLAIAASMRGPVARRALRLPWIATIGGMCYSIYLVHFPLFVVARRAAGVFGTTPYVLRFAWAAGLFVPAAIVVGAGYFLAVEKPCMDPSWPGRFLSWIDPRRRPSIVPERVIRRRTETMTAAD